MRSPWANPSDPRMIGEMPDEDEDCGYARAAGAPSRSTEDTRSRHRGIWSRRRHPFDQAAAIEEAWRFPSVEDDEDCGYDPRDPKHPTYHERMSGYADA